MKKRWRKSRKRKRRRWNRTMKEARKGGEGMSTLLEIIVQHKVKH